MLYTKLKRWKYMNIPIKAISTSEKPKGDILSTIHILITTNTNVVSHICIKASILHIIYQLYLNITVIRKVWKCLIPLTKLETLRTIRPNIIYTEKPNG